MSRPFFTILMPVYNARRYLGGVLRDLQRQSFSDFEIIAVDDGSTDGSSELLQTFNDRRMRVISTPENRGLVAALNAGLAEARGLWIARQDADDRCGADRLERQHRLILLNPEAVLVYSRAHLINGGGWWRGTMRPPVEDAGLRWDLCFRNAVPHTSVAFSKELVRDELGGYGGDNVTADYDLWSRLVRRGKAVGERRCLVSYRNHSGSIMGREHSSDDKPGNEGLRRIMKKNLMESAGSSASEAAMIAGAWLFPADADWHQYFTIRERLAARHPGISPLLIAEEDYTLLHRALSVSRDCAAEMIRVIRTEFVSRYHALPRFRTFLTRSMRQF